MAVALKDIAKILDEDDIIDIIDADEWVDIPDWDSVLVNRGEDWDGTEVYEDEIFYGMAIRYAGKNQFDVIFTYEDYEFDDEDEIISFIGEIFE